MFDYLKYREGIEVVRLRFEFHAWVKKLSESNKAVYQNPLYREIVYDFIEPLIIKYKLDYVNEIIQITSGHDYYSRCLLTKLITLKKEDLKKELKFQASIFEGGKNYDNSAFAKFLFINILDGSLKYKVLWNCNELDLVISQWIKENKDSFLTYSQKIRIIGTEAQKKLIISTLKEYCSRKSQKHIHHLLSGTLKEPIEFNNTISALAASINTLKRKRLLSSQENKVAAEWASKCFKCRSKDSENVIMYEPPSSRTILDVMTTNKKAARVKEDDIFYKIIFS